MQRQRPDAKAPGSFGICIVNTDCRRDIFMNQKLGRASVKPEQPVYILSSASVVGPKEGQGPLGLLFDVVGEDDMFGCETWEDAESSLQKNAVSLALEKSGMQPEDAGLIFAGDLLGQSIASSFGLSSFQIPLLGLYGACSTCGESLTLGAMSIAGGFADKVVCVTSSHFASAEKQFRFPLEYANQRPVSATWTVTGSGAFILSAKRSRIKITGITTGKIVDMGVKDSMNMGAAMAPAAANLIAQNLEDFKRKPEDYDKIITGDLGYVGQEILIDLLKKKKIDISLVHEDCGILIYDKEKQGTGSGGSGCGCSAVTLSAHYLPQLMQGKLKRILFVPTGALLSTVSFNEGQSVPGIAHAVVIEQEGEVE